MKSLSPSKDQKDVFQRRSLETPSTSETNREEELIELSHAFAAGEGEMPVPFCITSTSMALLASAELSKEGHARIERHGQEPGIETKLFKLENGPPNVP